jgi:endonuclease III
LVGKNASYDKIQKSLLNFVPTEFREKGFGYLWLFAKYTCKSQNPDCNNCLLSNLCENGKEKGFRKLAKKIKRKMQKKEE